jgi:hypothetical protein
MCYYRDKGADDARAFSALPLTIKRVQSNPIQRVHAQAALYDAPTMMELAESLPYTSPTSSTRARPSRRYASLPGRIPGHSASHSSASFQYQYVLLSLLSTNTQLLNKLTTIEHQPSSTSSITTRINKCGRRAARTRTKRGGLAGPTSYLVAAN